MSKTKAPQTNRYVFCGSVMVPVRKGSPYMAEFSASCGEPVAKLYWTAIKPA
jgi:hypothetical protein